MNNLNNTNNKRIALVTGAGRGIGKTIALRLAQTGIVPILLSRTLSDLKKVSEEIKEDGGSSFVVTCDVTDSEAVYKTIKDMMNKIEKIDILVNCAGTSGGGVTADISDELWLKVINTNLNSVFYVTKAVLKYGNMSTGGTIINIASTGGKQGVIHGAPYSASKHGVVGFTKALGLELARSGSGITVNAVCPGFVETEMAAKVRINYSKLWGVTEEEAKKRIEARIPIGRYIEPREVAEMVLYLCSNNARGVTAQALNVCGGLGNY